MDKCPELEFTLPTVPQSNIIWADSRNFLSWDYILVSVLKLHSCLGILNVFNQNKNKNKKEKWTVWH